MFRRKGEKLESNDIYKYIYTKRQRLLKELPYKTKDKK